MRTSILRVLLLGLLLGISMPAVSKNFYDFEFNTLEGESIAPSTFKGKVVLVVNTASMCGYSSQYGDLQKLYEKYQEKGLVILAIPSRDYLNQEFEEPSQIREFTTKKFEVTFLVSDLSHVKGKNRHPFYSWVEERLGYFSLPWWNFHKYLIDRKGELKGSFSTRTSPMDPNLIQSVESLLSEE